MKTNKYQRRFYRDWVKPKDLFRVKFKISETDLEIFTDKPVDKNWIIERIALYRRQITDYIIRDRRFLTALKPIPIELKAKPIIKEMAKSARTANVGPMAAVAGAIAGFLGKDLVRKGYKEIIIENGGDIFLKSSKERLIQIYPGKTRSWQNLALKIKPKDTPIGICTSSGKIGHSLSFGCADTVTILSKNISLADAVATATANLVNTKIDLEKAVDFVRSIPETLGVVIIFKNNLISWGKFKLIN